ncbi:ornithine cyclodeaminase [Cryptococcus wingfieldii CBS 7118]|uniref:Ornithine cyclodeaminase n=1 Tax=Cryptococcus wingfieldii CBS 7118 TaxID=1295528 RepID=A0A1E3JM81_9TREE|nr:ornithine cyclodeaminase [Cryptococcus wingfieldii CBS 7118]ODO01981.1 ornithine cyclodeaminase [Cryptococcus wingfieldii CBS 7118]
MSLRVVSGPQVDSILETLSPQLALASQAKVFLGFTRQANEAPTQGPASIQTPHRVTVNTPDFTLLFMPARAPVRNSEQETTATACKIVSVPSRGSPDGLPASTIVMDEVTGKARALINARKLTALRNACGSALFLSLYPTPKSDHLLLFGAGAQCLAHAQLFLRLRPFSQVTFVVRSINSRAESVASAVRSSFPSVTVSLAGHTSPSEKLSALVSTADVIVTATPSTTPLFTSSPSCPKPGARVVMIGSYKPEMHEVDSELMKRAGAVVVDSRLACLREAGELIDVGEGVAGGKGLIELGEILEEKDWQAVSEPSEEEKGNVIIFKSVGLGIQDVAITSLVADESERRNLGTVVEDYD